jgi:hypothetical protein
MPEKDFIMYYDQCCTCLCERVNLIAPYPAEAEAEEDQDGN